MTFDSTMLAAALLFGAAVFAWRAAPRDYLRFAAILFAALAVAVLLQPRVPGLGDPAALLVMPLGGAALGLFALARFARPLPSFAATLVLGASLGGGVIALLTGNALPALLPLAIAGLVIPAAALHRLAWGAALAGVLLFAGACAFAAQGAGPALLLLLAAAVLGLSGQARMSSSRAQGAVGGA